MSNNNSRNVYNNTEHGDDEEMKMLLNSSNSNQMTTIDIENDMTPGTSQQHLQRQQQLQQIRRDVATTRINMDAGSEANLQRENDVQNQNINDRQSVPNLFAMLRHQLNRSQSLRDPHSLISNGENISVNTQSRTWRENLYEVLSSPASSRTHTNVLRALFTSPSSANVRYDPLHTNVSYSGDQFQFTFNYQNLNQSETESSRNQHGNGIENQTASAFGLSRQNSRLTDDRGLNQNSTAEQQTPVIDSSTGNDASINTNNRRQSAAVSPAANTPQRQTSQSGSGTNPGDDIIDDADTNALGELIVKFVTHFIRYLPFIFIIFVKFIHDHLLGILDVLVLHGVVYQINKSLKDQVAKLNHKSFFVLVRDLILVVFVVTYRFILSSSPPDPFGLLINPPGEAILLELSSMQKKKPTNVVLWNTQLNKFGKEEHQIYEVPLSTTLSLGTLLYYVAVNDLILKLLTQLIKIVVTMFSTKIIRHKSRARLYALIEGISQLYRALAPIRQWLRFLFGSYTGLEVISGILFSSFYMGAKLFELFERGRSLKKSVINIMRDMNHDRKPTKDELEAAGTVCPICHDSYSSPVVTECGHIFCDECVSTWFKREQTCPMCRAKVSEDPTWQDGATTYFYQLC